MSDAETETEGKRRVFDHGVALIEEKKYRELISELQRECRDLMQRRDEAVRRAEHTEIEMARMKTVHGREIASKDRMLERRVRDARAHVKSSDSSAQELRSKAEEEKHAVLCREERTRAAAEQARRGAEEKASKMKAECEAVMQRCEEENATLNEEVGVARREVSALKVELKEAERRMEEQQRKVEKVQAEGEEQRASVKDMFAQQLALLREKMVEKERTVEQWRTALETEAVAREEAERGRLKATQALKELWDLVQNEREAVLVEKQCAEEGMREVMQRSEEMEKRVESAERGQAAAERMLGARGGMSEDARRREAAAYQRKVCAMQMDADAMMRAREENGERAVELEAAMTELEGLHRDLENTVGVMREEHAAEQRVSEQHRSSLEQALAAATASNEALQARVHEVEGEKTCQQEAAKMAMSRVVEERTRAAEEGQERVSKLEGALQEEQTRREECEQAWTERRSLREEVEREILAVRSEAGRREDERNAELGKERAENESLQAQKDAAEEQVRDGDARMKELEQRAAQEVAFAEARLACVSEVQKREAAKHADELSGMEERNRAEDEQRRLASEQQERAHELQMDALRERVRVLGCDKDTLAVAMEEARSTSAVLERRLADAQVSEREPCMPFFLFWVFHWFCRWLMAVMTMALMHSD